MRKAHSFVLKKRTVVYQTAICTQQCATFQYTTVRFFRYTTVRFAGAQLCTKPRYLGQKRTVVYRKAHGCVPNRDLHTTVRFSVHNCALCRARSRMCPSGHPGLKNALHPTLGVVRMPALPWAKSAQSCTEKAHGRVPNRDLHTTVRFSVHNCALCRARSRMCPSGRPGLKNALHPTLGVVRMRHTPPRIAYLVARG